MIAEAETHLPHRMRLIDRPGLQIMMCKFMENSAFPEKYIEEVELKDGSKVRIRPIRPDDAPRLQQAFSMLSPQTIYMRFLEAAKGLSDKQARQLAEVDYHSRMALVGTIQEADEERIVVVARYGMIQEDNTGLAEAAIVVRDDYQNRGLGKIAMERLVHYARENGVTAFMATVHTTNNRVMRFIQHSGLPFEKEMLEPGVWEIRIKL
jgi:RimJ/RimL family protein N-acetyltransferase